MSILVLHMVFSIYICQKVTNLDHFGRAVFSSRFAMNIHEWDIPIQFLPVEKLSSESPQLFFFDLPAAPHKR